MEANFTGASLLTMERPTGERQSSPRCGEVDATSQSMTTLDPPEASMEAGIIRRKPSETMRRPTPSWPGRRVQVASSEQVQRRENGREDHDEDRVSDWNQEAAPRTRTGRGRWIGREQGEGGARLFEDRPEEDHEEGEIRMTNTPCFSSVVSGASVLSRAPSVEARSGRRARAPGAGYRRRSGDGHEHPSPRPRSPIPPDLVREDAAHQGREKAPTLMPM